MTTYTLYNGDCLEEMKRIPDNSVDAIVTDPPAGIGFMGKEWDKDKGGRDNWIAWMESIARETMRVLKPGGHALVWSLPRTSHWTAMAWENAGYEPRDRIAYIFGSGFPKSHDISKAIDREAGAEREVIKKVNGAGSSNTESLGVFNPEYDLTAPETPEAQQWQGWGTGLKPAIEDWWLFRKPISEKTIAQNVLKWGTGAINVDGCRIPTSAEDKSIIDAKSSKNPANNYSCKSDKIYGSFATDRASKAHTNGRFPSHLIHDGSEEACAGFPETDSKGNKSGKRRNRNANGEKPQSNVWALNKIQGNPSFQEVGSASRYFYCAKASKADRDEGLDRFDLVEGGNDKRNGKNRPQLTLRHNHHPTVKPTALMTYLCRLITPPGGVVLDPFMGSGSTGKAAILEGFHFIGIEQNADYLEIARARIEHAYTILCNKQGDYVPMEKEKATGQISMFEAWQ